MVILPRLLLMAIFIIRTAFRIVEIRTETYTTGQRLVYTQLQRAYTWHLFEKSMACEFMATLAEKCNGEFLIYSNEKRYWFLIFNKVSKPGRGQEQEKVRESQNRKKI